MYLCGSGTADMPIDRANKLQIDSMSDAISFAMDSSEQVQGTSSKYQGGPIETVRPDVPEVGPEEDLGGAGGRVLR
jgi:hypothetical protein